MTALQAEPVRTPEPPREQTPASRPDQHFSTDHLMADLKGRSVRGGVVTLSAQAAKFVLQLGSTAVLARLLTPADFGLIAMVTAITGFAALFKDLGLSQATVQRDKITHEQVSCLFWINVIASAGIGLVVAAMAPLVAWFYGEPRLMWVTVALGSTFILGGLTAQHTALLRRQMRYLPLAKIEIVSLLTGIIVAVAMAFAGADYWALVGMVAGSAAANMVGAWLASGWRPGGLRRQKGMRSLVGFGGNLTLANFGNHAREHVPLILVGYVSGTQSLAVYERAYRLLLHPLHQVVPPLAAVAIPALSRVQSDPERFPRAVRTLSVLTVSLSVPLSLIAITATPEIVAVFLGPNWNDAATLLLLFSPLAVTQALSSVAIWTLTTSGGAVHVRRFSTLNAILAILSVAVALPYGIAATAASFSIVGLCVRTPLLYWIAARNSPAGLSSLVAPVAPLITAGVLLAGAVLTLRWYLVGFDVNFTWGATSVPLMVALWLMLLTLMGTTREICHLVRTRAMFA